MSEASAFIDGQNLASAGLVSQRPKPAEAKFSPSLPVSQDSGNGVFSMNLSWNIGSLSFH